MTPERVQAWLDAYVAAWDTYDEAASGSRTARAEWFKQHPRPGNGNGAG